MVDAAVKTQIECFTNQNQNFVDFPPCNAFYGKACIKTIAVLLV